MSTDQNTIKDKIDDAMSRRVRPGLVIFLISFFVCNAGWLVHAFNDFHKPDYVGAGIIILGVLLGFTGFFVIIRRFLQIAHDSAMTALPARRANHWRMRAYLSIVTMLIYCTVFGWTALRVLGVA